MTMFAGVRDSIACRRKMFAKMSGRSRLDWQQQTMRSSGSRSAVLLDPFHVFRLWLLRKKIIGIQPHDEVVEAGNFYPQTTPA